LILRRRRERRRDEVNLERVTHAQELLAMRQAVEEVYVDADLEGYIVALVNETRRDRRVTVGASPRGSLALLKLARARAALAGRDYTLPDDVKAFIQPALSHRLILVPDLWMKHHAAEEVLAAITQAVPVPVIEGA
jgi:MoxR-like ATPase